MGVRLSALACIGLMAQAAWAAPPGVVERGGNWIAPDGKPLYTFARDADGKSSCVGSCATAWPPLAAAPDAVGDDDWTIVARDDGSRMWAYKGQPLYTYSRDTPGEPASGASASWPLAKR